MAIPIGNAAADAAPIYAPSPNKLDDYIRLVEYQKNKHGRQGDEFTDRVNADDFGTAWDVDQPQLQQQYHDYLEHHKPLETENDPKKRAQIMRDLKDEELKLKYAIKSSSDQQKRFVELARQVHSPETSWKYPADAGKKLDEWRSTPYDKRDNLVIDPYSSLQTSVNVGKELAQVKPTIVEQDTTYADGSSYKKGDVLYPEDDKKKIAENYYDQMIATRPNEWATNLLEGAQLNPKLADPNTTLEEKKQYFVNRDLMIDRAKFGEKNKVAIKQAPLTAEQKNKSGAYTPSGYQTPKVVAEVWDRDGQKVVAFGGKDADLTVTLEDENKQPVTGVVQEIRPSTGKYKVPEVLLKQTQKDILADRLKDIQLKYGVMGQDNKEKKVADADPKTGLTIAQTKQYYEDVAKAHDELPPSKTVVVHMGDQNRTSLKQFGVPEYEELISNVKQPRKSTNIGNLKKDDKPKVLVMSKADLKARGYSDEQINQAVKAGKLKLQ